jgi:hypothetical protein
MNNDLHAQIRTNLNQKETGELIAIWKKHDLNEWTDLTFDVVQEILQERQVELPSQDKPNYPKFSPEIAKITDIGELERKIKESETLNIQAEGKKTTGWIPLIISLGIAFSALIKIPSGGIFYVVMTILGLLYVGVNIWRISSAEKQKKEIEFRLKEYRDRKAELQVAKIVIDREQQVSQVSDQDIVTLVTASQSQNKNDKMSALIKLGILISGDIETVNDIINRSYKAIKTCEKCGFDNPEITDFCLNCLSDIHWAKVNLGKFTGTINDTVLIGLASRREHGVLDS